MLTAKKFSLDLNGWSLRFADSGDGQVVLFDTLRNQRLFIMPVQHLMIPVFNEHSESVKQIDVQQSSDQKLTIRYEADGLQDFTVTLTAQDDYLDISCSFCVLQDMQLNRLNLIPVGTMMNLYDVVNFRNRHFTSNTWPELNMGSSFSTGTYSDDWQFAPHPSLFVFRKDNVHLLTALSDLSVGTFGMHLSIEKYKVTHWFLDYGNHPNGLSLKACQRFQSPRLRLMLGRNETVYEALDAFGNTLWQEQLIPDIRPRQAEPWWKEPLYCTWIDQTYCANTRIETDLKLQSMEPNLKPAEVLNEEFVRTVAEVIRNERLPVRTILIDEGWNVTRGQWEAHSGRFPDMRKLVDDLHGMGLKVMVWLGWPDVFDDAEIPEEFLCGRGAWRHRHGQRFIDFSLPATQEDYLKPLIRKLFSSDPDCYDLDGFKTDFQADKVHPETPLFDSEWRGEENYLMRVTRLLYEEMKVHKPDGMHLGCAGHFWIAPYIDCNRTYDVHSSNWREHENRALMLQHTAPGCPVSYDFHNFVENLDEWFESARRLGAAVELSNLLFIKQDICSEVRKADAEYYDHLRALMKA